MPSDEQIEESVKEWKNFVKNLFSQEPDFGIKYRILFEPIIFETKIINEATQMFNDLTEHSNVTDLQICVEYKGLHGSYPNNLCQKRLNFSDMRGQKLNPDQVKVLVNNLNRDVCSYVFFENTNSYSYADRAFAEELFFHREKLY